MAGWDSGVVHPFVALLWSDGGQYISKNGTKAQFDDARGLAVLNLYMSMIQDKSIDLSLNMTDFVNGKSAMIIMANWWHTTMQKQFKDGFANVGVAPIPHGPNRQPITLQYNWMWTVAKDTKNRTAAWKLASWLNQAGSHKASPTGTFLAEQLGAIPSRVSDQQALTSKYFDDDFMKVFLTATKHAQPEPPVRGGQEVKTTLQQDIEAAWYGKKSPSDALADAAQKADQTLAQNR
jgi:multiple sugar transport system substrate-binding protein